MKLLAIGDMFIPADVMQNGLTSLTKYGVDITVREWKHENLEALQKDNLIVEQQGPEAVKLPDELTAGMEQFDILIVQFAPVAQSLIAKAGKLKMIGVLRGGVENVDCDYAAGRNIAVLNNVGRNARAVAEFTVGMILAEVRNIARSHAALQKGIWMKEFPNSGSIPELYHKNVGIVGLGHVGKLIAGYLQAFGCNILAYDPYIKEKGLDQIKIVSLNELLQQADIISVNARLTEDTYHLIGAEQISLMKKTAVIVNTARSGLIDQHSLIKALKAKQIRGAALDVFDVEPLLTDDEILGLDNITLTSHIAGSTREAFTNSPKLMAGIIEKVLLKNANLPSVNGITPVL
ncbi:D-3-phosphoglycerate dehydrogenase [Sporomusaceae bacterium BoRhaA]|uniref:2-hydroxyacid dehydrogenase n=1 Tax=Pelorhabdus rhamnosifermentans TaxID=2772457 RepID=UPI001C061ABA|nr:2-hydroxyacid dehydrogenase [Pelorhabdus rhamnosifermentans]MBU2699118.1 D-3-phosphoglycerate dehydrogenase [Pelorhabdus rhamnosifermentans]